MRVIFLDMDGVLNSGYYLHVENPINLKGERELNSLGERAAGRRWEEMIDPRAVARLNTIIERTGAKVVLSSSWRIQFKEPHEMDEFRRILKSRGFTGEVIDRTPVGREILGGSGGVRGIEVAAWLADHEPADEVTSFIILDDSDDFPGLEDRLIRTSWGGTELGGLLDEHIERAVAMLEEG